MDVRPLALTTSNCAVYLAGYSSDGQYHQRRFHFPVPLGSVHSRTKHDSWPTGTRMFSKPSTEMVAYQALPSGPVLPR